MPCFPLVGFRRYEQLKKEEPLIRDWYRPHNERLFRLLGRDFGWNS